MNNKNVSVDEIKENLTFQFCYDCDEDNCTNCIICLALERLEQMKDDDNAD